MTAYTYSRVAALNFNTTPPTVARSATGSVYATADTTFTTPLTITMVVGGSTTTTVSSDSNGFFPDFTVADRVSVVWKQSASSFTTVLTTSDPVPGPTGATGAAGATGAKGDRGDLATWQTATFYPLNQAIINPSGDIVKVITAHTSGGSYDATKFDYANNTVVDAQTAAKINDGASATRAALNATYAGKSIETSKLDVTAAIKPSALTALPQRVAYTGRSIADLAFFNGMATSGTVASAFTLASGTVTFTASSGIAGNLAIAAIKGLFADGRISALINLTSATDDKYAGLVFRHTSSGYLAALINEGASGRTVTVYAFNGGFTSLFSAAVPSNVIAGATSAELAVEIRGNRFDLFVNGVRVGGAGGDVIPDAYLEAGAVGLVSNDARTSTWRNISFTESDYRFARPQATKQLSIGTSLCYGYGLSSPSTQAYPIRFGLAAGAAMGHAVTVSNRGISGALSDAILADLPTGIAAGPYDIATLELSVNDAKPSLGLTAAQTRANTLKMISLLKANSIVPIMFGTPPFSGTAFAPDMTTASWQKAAEINAIGQQLASEQNIFFIDIGRLFSGDYTTYTTDGLHYTATGAQMVADAAAAVYAGAARR